MSSRSKELLDFLEVVQKGRFLETIGQVPYFGCNPAFNAPLPSDNTDGNKGE